MKSAPSPINVLRAKVVALDAELARLRAEVERLKAGLSTEQEVSAEMYREAQRQRARAERAEAERDEMEGRYESSHASRRHAEWALEKAQAEVERLRAALRHAVEWLDEQGCDCGTDEPGTCALCEANAALRGEVEK